MTAVEEQTWDIPGLSPEVQLFALRLQSLLDRYPESELAQEENSYRVVMEQMNLARDAMANGQPQAVLDALEQLVGRAVLWCGVAARQRPLTLGPRTWEHCGNGQHYEVIGTATLKTDVRLAENATLVVYRDPVQGQLYVREADAFLERFSQLFGFFEHERHHFPGE